MKVEWKACFKICVSLFLLYLSITYWSTAANLIGVIVGAAMPLLIGCVIAYLANILMSCYERHYFTKSSNKTLVKSRRPVIGAIVGAFMILTFSPVKAIIFLVFIVILQQLEGNIIYPKVVGASMGLPGIWVLAAVTVGGGVMGIPGMPLGVPLAAAIYRLLREDVNKISEKVFTEI